MAWIIGGIAAVIGGLAAAIILQWSTPYVIFSIYACFGLLVSASALLIPKRLEED